MTTMKKEEKKNRKNQEKQKQNKYGNLEKIAILRQYKQPVFPGSIGSAAP